MKSYADRRLKTFDLTLEQMQVLKNTSIEIGLTQRKLSEETFKSPANMTRILDRMEKKNIIVRKNNPDDRRSSLVFLTEEGESLREKVVMLFNEMDTIAVRGIPLEAQALAMDVLEKITMNIEAVIGK